MKTASDGLLCLDEKATFSLYLPGLIREKEALGRFEVDAMISNSLKPNMLLGTTLVGPNGAVISYPKKPLAKPYNTSAKDEAVIDEKLDGLQAEGKPDWMRRATPFSCPVFVVWRTVDGKPMPETLEQLETYIAAFKPTAKEIEAFEILQDQLTRPAHLVHWNPERRTFIKIDAYQRGIGVMIFYLKATCRMED
ncbi:hypothetical protein B0T18DRAFT_425237 [Schizothecium vesticola]|uniref:Uncharacterized protein n=1 Tax=Schizothecium vesticola TaxID=314040 RepID=A0AA40FC37_9PEZI|nr:hypothetical protein B0T18DRAFT_425237 [Schizothecium vesticola]